MWLWVHLAPEYASLLPDEQGLALNQRGAKNYHPLGIGVVFVSYKGGLMIA